LRAGGYHPPRAGNARRLYRRPRRHGRDGRRGLGVTLPNDLTLLTVADARAALDNKEISSVELTQAYLNRIDAVEGAIHAYLHIMRDVALTQASDADRRIADGEVDRMTGIPVALKDILSTTDAPTTAA